MPYTLSYRNPSLLNCNAGEKVEIMCLNGRIGEILYDKEGVLSGAEGVKTKALIAITNPTERQKVDAAYSEWIKAIQ
jgi:hypothetical protein